MQQPPKRRQLADGLELSDNEHERFLAFLQENGLHGLVTDFIEDVGSHLRGRMNGPQLTSALPCGYLFLSEDSFDRGHAPVAHIDPMPLSRPPIVSFREWNHVRPFSDADWNALGVDPRQKEMRACGLTPSTQYKEAVRLGRLAREHFSDVFDTSIDRN